MKLSFSTIIIMAVSIAFGILSFAVFHQTIPTLAAAKNYTQYKEQLETEARKAPAAQKRVEKAMRAVQQKADAWNAYVAVRTPESDVSRNGINLAVDPYQLTVDTLKFKNSIQRAVNEQVKRGGVTVLTAPVVRGPASTDDAGALLADYYNYSTYNFPVVLFDFGTVVVTGTYDQIVANVRAYKSMPHYLAVTDGLQITGTSPHLTGTYSLSIVGFIRGKEIFPSVPSSGGTAGAGGRGGFAGGGRGLPGGFAGGPSGPGAPLTPPSFAPASGGGASK